MPVPKLKPPSTPIVECDRLCHQCEGKGEAMGNLLYWAVVFLVVAVVAAVLGFGGVAGTAMAGAQLLFWVAIVLLSSPWSPASFGAGSSTRKNSKGRRQLPPAFSCECPALLGRLRLAFGSWNPLRG